jgi:hypothetical protein
MQGVSFATTCLPIGKNAQVFIIKSTVNKSFDFVEYFPLRAFIAEHIVKIILFPILNDSIIF